MRFGNFRNAKKGGENMTLAEKVAILRKQKGWSQEELAEKLGISRQAVSKWEGGSSIPDIDKIVGMSRLFGVSTDYLLKEESFEAEPAFAPESASEKKEAVRSVSQEEACTYLELSRKLSKRFAAAVFVLILSPVCLILSGGIAEYKNTQLTENMAGGICVAVLLVLIAAAVAVLIFAGMQTAPYEYLEKEKIELSYGVQSIVKEKKEAFTPVFRLCITAGTVLCILSVVPLMVAYGMGAGDFVYICCVCILLALVASGVFLFVWSGNIHGSFEKLLQEGDYTDENKELNKRVSFFPGIYWCLATALYLYISFTRNNWEVSWIVWPVAGVLFAALYGVVRAVAKAKK